jgi:SAM-dependent methyltransferase
VPDFARRSHAREWLDMATPSPAERAAYLKSLAWFNRAMLGHRPVLTWLGAAMRGLPPGEPSTLLDVGCGYGDLLRAIRHWANRHGLRMRLIGIDLNADTIAIAREATPHDDSITYLVGDVFNLRPTARIDFVASSLLAHHLPDDAIVRFLRWMETTARRGWLVADLQRHPVPYHAIGIAGPLSRIHPMVVKDGRLSVMRALTRPEWQTTITAAGLDWKAVRLRWFLYRYAVSRLRREPLP